MREGDNSLITYPNASTFSIFNHIRHVVLQQELCNTYNFRNKSGEDQESEVEDSKEEGKDGDKQKEKLPEVSINRISLDIFKYRISLDVTHQHCEDTME